jgi:citrate synthase
MELEKIALKIRISSRRSSTRTSTSIRASCRRHWASRPPCSRRIFALARTVGWMTQWEEMITDPEYKIGRPRQLYVGSARRDVPDVAKR